MKRCHPLGLFARAAAVLALFLAGLNAVAQNYTHYDLVVPNTATGVKTIIDGSGRIMPANRSYIIGLEGGTHGPLVFSNWIAANPLYPVIVVNIPGNGRAVISDVGGANATGITLENCAFFKVLGNNDPAHYYGIEVAHGGGTASTKGISAGYICTNIEIAYLDIHHVSFAGIMAKTDPVTSKPETWSANYVMHDLYIHDNYVHDTGGEGMYIGLTGWSTDNVPEEPGYEGHEIKGLKISYNLVERTGWDGLQYSSAPDDPSTSDDDAEVFNNIIHSPAVLNHEFQRAGLVIGGGAGGKVYNNLIIGGTGANMSLFGRGYNTVYNNLLVGGNVGIFADNRGTEDPRQTVLGSYQSIYNNTFIIPTSHAYWTMNERTVNNFKNNLSVVADLGATDAYAHPGDENQDPSSVTTAGNLLLRTNSGADFVNPAENDYRILSTSSGANIGVSLASLPSGEVSVTTDFEGLPRPQGAGYDAGLSETGALSLFLVSTPPTTGNTGSIKASVIGGTTPYTYAWSNSATTQTISSLPQGLYSVTVTDAVGAKVKAATYISNGSAIGAPVRVAQVNEVIPPAFSPAVGTFTTAQSVTLSSATSGASIRYTTDGSTPSPTTGALYSGAIPASSSTVITAIAYKTGMAPSVISKGTFVINDAPANTKFTIVNADITESGHKGNPNTKDKTIDGNLGTWWRGNFDDWIRYDLGSNQRVGLIKMAFNLGHQCNYFFDLQVSTDGTNWTNVLTNWSSNLGLGLQDFDIPDVEPVRYVRFVSHGNNHGNANLVLQSDYAEIEIWGGPAGSASAPTIVTQPVSQTQALGGTATFSVTATGTPSPTYQWKKNGATLSGATSSTYQIINVQVADAGSYAVDVTNASGSITSSAATLTVDAGSLGQQLQGENATLYGAVVASTQPGYNGTGYADFIHASGNYVEWTASNPAAATRTLTFRYATAGTTRTLSLSVNGTVVDTGLTFNATTGSNWAIKTTSVALPSGTVTIRLTSTGQNGPNVDYLQVD